MERGTSVSGSKRASGSERQANKVKQVDEHGRLVTFMHYDLGYVDDEICGLEPIDNPFGPSLLPMSPEEG